MTHRNDNDLLLKRIYRLKDEYDNIIKRLSEIGACSTIEKIKKECGLKMSILDELIELGKNNDKTDKRSLAEKAYRIINRGDIDDQRGALMEIMTIREDPDASGFMLKMVKAYGLISQKNRWSFRIFSESRSKKGLLKEVSIQVSGPGALRYLKYESGQHRLIKNKKSPVITITVYPLIQKKEIEIDPGDINIDVSKSSGPGGQSVNTSDSSVRITHIPSGLTAKSQQERTQTKNKYIAMQMLRSKLIRAEKENMINIKKARRDEILFGYGIGTIKVYDLEKDTVYEKATRKSISGIDAYLKDGIDSFVSTMLEGEEIKKIDSYFFNR